MDLDSSVCSKQQEWKTLFRKNYCSGPFRYDPQLLTFRFLPVNPLQSRRTHAPTVLSDTLLLTYLPRAKLSVLFLSSRARRFLIARSPFNLLASPSQPLRRPRQQAEEMLLAVRVAAVKLAVDAAVVVAKVVAVDALLVVYVLSSWCRPLLLTFSSPRARRVLSYQLPRSYL